MDGLPIVAPACLLFGIVAIVLYLADVAATSRTWLPSVMHGGSTAWTSPPARPAAAAEAAKVAGRGGPPPSDPNPGPALACCQTRQLGSQQMLPRSYEECETVEHDRYERAGSGDVLGG